MTAKKKESALHKKLSGELVSLIPSLDEKGLAFLVEQAGVHLRNMEIDRLNAEIEESERAAEASAAREGNAEKGKNGKGKTGSAGKGKSREPKPETADFRIDRSPSGASYHIVSGGKWKMFTDGEMLAMVKISQSKDPVLEVAERLHRWLSEERPDAFVDLDIGDRFDPKMKELVAILRKKFAVRKG